MLQPRPILWCGGFIIPRWSRKHPFSEEAPIVRSRFSIQQQPLCRNLLRLYYISNGSDGHSDSTCTLPGLRLLQSFPILISDSLPTFSVQNQNLNLGTMTFHYMALNDGEI